MTAVREGDHVTVHTALNDGRYDGRRGIVARRHIDGLGKCRLVVQLDKFSPGWEAPDGILYLYEDEVRRIEDGPSTGAQC